MQYCDYEAPAHPVPGLFYVVFPRSVTIITLHTGAVS